MNTNDAMIQVAEILATRYGFITVHEPYELDALKDKFWGNQVIGMEAQRLGKKHTIKTCKYIIPTFEEDKAGGCNGTPRIDIDMFFGKPRLNVSLPDKTFVAITYKEGKCNEVQAFGENGINLAGEVKDMIDGLLK